MGWSHDYAPIPKVVAIRSTDEIPALNDSEWVIIGYETLAGRDERIEVDDEEMKNALSAFFKKSYGHGPSERDDGWMVKVRVADASKHTEPQGIDNERKKWCFIAKANLEAASRMQQLLGSDRSAWMSPALRGRVMRMAVRLERPVVTALQAWSPEAVVVDEAHRVKGAYARRTRAVRGICAGRQVLLLTGTPLRNHAEDGRALLEILSPDGVWKTLKRKDPRVKQMVKKALAWCMIRRLKNDVLKELPPKLRQRIPVRVAAEELAAYAGAMYAAEECYARERLKTGSSAKARRSAMGC